MTLSKVDFRVNQFSIFYDLLMSNAPEGYNPWFFPCSKNGKNPCPKAILNIDSTSNGSWHHESARLNKEQCIEHIKKGYNIGISARKGDPLIIGDIDEAEFLNQLPEDTLTTTSRKRCGGHFFGWNKDDSAKINLPTDYGELRSDNQYVLCCGSYVGFDLNNEKDKKAFDKLSNEAQKDELLGYYTIRNHIFPRPLSFDDCPRFFHEKTKENISIESEIKQKEEKKTYQDKEGKYTELFNLKVSDIVGLIPANKRTGHPLHDSDTDANFSLSKDGTIGHCWRHLVSLNAVQYLCVKAGYKKCEDAGTPHSNRGISKIKGDKKALEVAYQEALKLGLINEWKIKKNNPEIEREINVNQFIITEYFETGKREGEVKSHSVNIDKVAKYIENKFNIRTIYGIREETIEIYDNGVWSVKGRGVIKAEVERLLGVYSKNNIVIEILEKIKRRTEISREEADIIPDYKRCVLNGVLDLEDVNDIKFLEHSKDYNFRNKFLMNYNPNAQCPKIIEFLKKTFYEEDVLKIQEWLGFHLIRRYAFKRAVIIHGARNTGKSVFLNLLNIFVNHNVSGLSLQEIARGKPFDLLVLKDKDANIHDDMSSQDMKSIGGFKMAVGDGFISAEQKFGDKIRFRNTAKDTNACNKLPNPGEDIDDEAYYERILLIPADNTIPKELQNKNLIDEITTPEELSGLLNWAIEGYKRLVTQNGFSFEKTPEETKYLMLKNGNSLAEFSAEVLIDSAGDKIIKDDLYKIYCNWCLNHKPKLSPDSKDKMGKNLIKFNPFIQSESNGKARYWLNVKINDSYDIFLKHIRHISNSSKNSKIDKNISSQNNIYVFSKPVIPVTNNQLQNLEKMSKMPLNEIDFSELEI